MKDDSRKRKNVCDGSYQLDVKLSDHLDLEVDDVSVTDVPEEKDEKHRDY